MSRTNHAQKVIDQRQGTEEQAAISALEALVKSLVEIRYPTLTDECWVREMNLVILDLRIACHTMRPAEGIVRAFIHLMMANYITGGAAVKLMSDCAVAAMTFVAMDDQLALIDKSKDNSAEGHD